VPFPIDGIYFLSFDRIEKMIEYLDERKKSRWELVEEVLSHYEEAKNSFANKYPAYYAKAQNKYPSKTKLARRFYFEYQFLKISAPDHNPMISPEQYKREMAKFRDTINEMKQEVVGIIYHSLSSLTNRLKRQSKDGKMNQRTFNNLHKFLEQIDSTYTEFIDRKDLQETLKKVKAEIKGMSADMLRDNDAQRAKFHKAIAALTTEIQALPDVETKRAIDF
jgi:flavorubredoxin